MYAPNYSFGQGNNTQSFNPNGGHPQAPQNVHQQGQQQPQHMMYNAQQYGPGGHQSPYGASGPGMAGNAGGMGMMQNSGLAHMAGGNVVPSYQTPYTSSPYGNNIATSSSVSHPSNFMPTASNAPPQYGMNPSAMIPQQQHQIQRMQPPPSSTPTPTSANSRVSPYGNFPQSTPPSASNAQFAVPPNLNQQHHQTPNNNQQGGISLTPQTPSFPPGVRNSENAGAAMSTPLSPGSELREKERVTVLLDINREMLLEIMRIIALQTDLKNNKTEDPAEKATLEAEQKLLATEYMQCMRRLQSNLAYLAAIADRSHKPAAQIPSHPAIMFAPTLTYKPAHTIPISAPTNDDDPASKPEEGHEDRREILKEAYERLQALYPGVDPKKDTPAGPPNATNRAQAQAQQHVNLMQAAGQKQGDMGQGVQNMMGGQNGMAQGQGQMVQGGMGGMVGMGQMQQLQQQGQQNMGMPGLNQNQNQLQQQQQQQHQQKMQNEMMRQRMMQEAQKNQMMNMGQMPGR
ncbi:hypothetical protein BCIN_07g03270 [Botrytis cinerea B05.10]|uniref:Uncharacterized protein n=3 Tax=Botryotinia fuckeliana TaxID=40559 RepID=A0A384JML3_BOTFB|nr:hypothetical protein BCIN_07g03270 [Botrytis cinerea B05.10]ATZ51742.1 hypothetical protein BCIN_07g03270 [Botrytis cinerea B05.10]EMR80902.1 putative glutamine repeat protein-1 protein [Botrytis cinerea BcDW1]